MGGFFSFFGFSSFIFFSFFGLGSYINSSYLGINGGQLYGKLAVNSGSIDKPQMSAFGGNGDRYISYLGSTLDYPCSVGIGTNCYWNSASSNFYYSWYIGGNEKINMNTSGAGRRGPLWLPLQARKWRVIHSNTAPLGLPPGREPGPGTD